MERISPSDVSDLERFFRAYVENRQGDWDECEPAVYDVMMEDQVRRLAFDPEALPDHPGAELATQGAPAVDEMLADARRRWSRCQCYRQVGHVLPHDLADRVPRFLPLPKPAAWGRIQARAVHVPHAICHLALSLRCEHQQQYVLVIGIDLSSGREVRHLDRLLEKGSVVEHETQPLPDAARIPLALAVQKARTAALRTATALANAVRRELGGQLLKQIARTEAYYDRLIRELEPGEQSAQRADSYQRQKGLRLVELRGKNELSLGLSLAGLMILRQPKVIVAAEVDAPRRGGQKLRLTWDPLLEAFEPPDCPHCGRPTTQLRLDTLQELRCAAC